MNCNCIKQLDIRLTKDYFYPGELIDGKLVVDVAQSFNLNVIHLLVRGKAHCEWKVFVSGQRRIIKDDQYFIDERTEIWAPSSTNNEEEGEEDEQTESDQQENEKSFVKQGIHEFHFSFRLSDANIPCSLESRACSIRYHLRAILDVPETDDIPQGIKYFTILGPIIDCNDNRFLNPLFGSEKRWRYCLCCRQQSASLRCILDRSAYCSGETIKLKSFIRNYSTEAVKLKVRLVQFCEFNAEKGVRVTKEVQHLVLEYTSDLMVPTEELDLITNHSLPVLPPSLVGVTRLVQLYYTMTVCLEFEHSGNDLEMLFPIKIATKPFTEGPNDFSVEFAPCCNHVEGGIYLDPEFLKSGSRFWEDNEDSEVDSEMPIYRPVYLKVVKNPPPEKSVNNVG